MLNLFGKTPKEKLEAKYLKLIEKANKLEKKNVSEASKVRHEAQRIMHEIVLLDKSLA